MSQRLTRLPRDLEEFNKAIDRFSRKLSVVKEAADDCYEINISTYSYSTTREDISLMCKSLTGIEYKLSFTIED